MPQKLPNAPELVNPTGKRLVEIFHQAKDLPAGSAREKFLDASCGEDTRLRGRLARLLTADESAGDFLTPPPLNRGSPTVSERPGDWIDRYKLVEKIGEGGCGVVYLAEQEVPVRRRVALKIIKLGMDTEQVIARFEAERQALALMEHPNIAQVFDGGSTATGRPYFVMEAVRGTKITEFCDENKLSTEERLNLFIQVCQAIQHAHQKGIIHRDIKPSNILVTVQEGVPVPKVIDFGIAKATEQKLTKETVYTALEQFIGTPAYMSPEQADMTSVDIDTRSDIYALGVLLYELLTGNTPFDAEQLVASGLNEIRRVIRETEPPTPSTRLRALTSSDLTIVAGRRRIEQPKLIQRVRGDLDWIAMKCLEKDRARRYETASALAADLNRHLNDEPVLARPASRSYRFRKLVRRNTLAFAAGTAIAASVVIGLTVAMWLYFRESAALERATEAEKLSNKRLAEVSAERDSKEVARQEAEAIATFLSEVFASPDPARDGRAITVAETLERASYKLMFTLADQPARRARLQATLGETYRALGLHGEGIPLLEKVLSYHRIASGEEHPETLKAMHNLAISYGPAGRRDEASELLERALNLSRKVLGPEHQDTLRAMQNVASFYSSAGRSDEALKLREETLALHRKTLGRSHLATLKAMQNLANSYSAAGRQEEALKLRREVLESYQREVGPEHAHTIGAMHGLASSYFAAGRKGEALLLREEVVALQRKVSGPEHPETANAMHNLALSYFDGSRKEEALKLREEVLALQKRVSGPEHSDTLLAMNTLAMSYADAGRRDEALKLREHALGLRRKVGGPEHPQTLAAMEEAARSYFPGARRIEAIKLREDVLMVRRKLGGPDHPTTIEAMRRLEDSYRANGQEAEAKALEVEIAAAAERAKASQKPR